MKVDTENPIWSLIKGGFAVSEALPPKTGSLADIRGDKGSRIGLHREMKVDENRLYTVFECNHVVLYYPAPRRTGETLYCRGCSNYRTVTQISKARDIEGLKDRWTWV